MNTREGGFSIVELGASLTLLIFGLLSMAVGFHGATRLADSTRDNYLLHMATRNMVAELQGATFETLTTEYGAGSGKEDFWVGLLDPVNQAVGEVVYSAPVQTTTRTAAGSIQFFTGEQTMPTTWTGVSGGVDLDFDGNVSGTSATDYQILPVRLDIVVPGADGPRTLVQDIILTKPRA
jgi:type II secretory pathway pseudopilin PulG